MKFGRLVFECLLKELQFLDKKSFGLLLSSRADNIVDDYYIFKKDKRQDAHAKHHFEKIGKYYSYTNDAGFLSDPEEQYLIEEFISKKKLKVISLFHVHRRHPAFFSHADWKLHTDKSIHHVIISLRNIFFPEAKCFSLNNSNVKNQLFSEVPVEIVEIDSINISNIFFANKNLNPYQKKIIFSYLYGRDRRFQKVFWDTYFPIKHSSNYSYNGNGILIHPVTNDMYNEFACCDGESGFPKTDVSFIESYLFASWSDHDLVSNKEWIKNCDDTIGDDIYNHYNQVLDRYAVFSENSNGKLSKVMTKEANKHSLFDMQGNVWEWVVGDAVKGFAITKGGSYRAFPEMCQPLIDHCLPIDYFACDLGFRLKSREQK